MAVGLGVGTSCVCEVWLSTWPLGGVNDSSYAKPHNLPPKCMHGLGLSVKDETLFSSECVRPNCSCVESDNDMIGRHPTNSRPIYP